jgi:hypothetical protein
MKIFKGKIGMNKSNLIEILICENYYQTGKEYKRKGTGIFH